jgi:hypothetical protein
MNNQRTKELIRTAVKGIPAALSQSVFLVGLALIARGTWLIYKPAGWIVTGVLCVVFSSLGETKPKR